MAIYIFIRPEGFYPIELRDDADAKANAACNPGTLRVEDAVGRVVWLNASATADSPLAGVTPNSNSVSSTQEPKP